VSKVINPDHRNSPCACHDVTPRISCGFRLVVSFCRLLATLQFQFLITFRSVTLNLEIVLLPDGYDGEAAKFDASGKPKPFSSVDERDVEPLFLIAREEFPRVFSRYTSEMRGQ
jgi:hypothetical protein